MLAAFKFFGGSHKPVHSQVHGPEQVIKWPNHPWPIGSARQLALSSCIAGRHSSCVVLSILSPATCRPVHRYSSSGQTSCSLLTKILSLGRGECLHEEGNLWRSTRYGSVRQSASRSCPSSRHIVLVYSSDKPMVLLL